MRQTLTVIICKASASLSYLININCCFLISEYYKYWSVEVLVVPNTEYAPDVE